VRTHYDVLIVGGGHSGAQAALHLRNLKYAGSIAVVSDELVPPYERPPLSKEYMSGEKAFEEFLIRPLASWESNHIELLLGHRVLRVDSEQRTVFLSKGKVIGYGSLIWATGGAPRALTCPGVATEGIYSIRNRANVDAILGHLAHTNHVLIIGGGYIGLEAAAVLRKLNKDVTLLEALDRVLARVAGRELSMFVEQEHRRHGVRLRTGTTVARIESRDGRAEAVVLADGERIKANLIIAGIGIVPTTDPLTQAGARGSNGVDVDEFCRTSLENVYAIGDCAAHPNRFAGGARIRLESVQNANDQARAAVHHILGKALPYDAVPWFWSNQYDLKLQTVGLSSRSDQVVVRGDISRRSFSLIYLLQGKVIALDCVNAVRDYVHGRHLVLSEAAIDVKRLADSSIPLKSLGG
jgi:3-phenylpropionate/trans-cinnamate dioxygenase ferredoxin reductase subunit